MAYVWLMYNPPRSGHCNNYVIPPHPAGSARHDLTHHNLAYMLGFHIRIAPAALSFPSTPARWDVPRKLKPTSE